MRDILDISGGHRSAWWVEIADEECNDGRYACVRPCLADIPFHQFAGTAWEWDLTDDMGVGLTGWTLLTNGWVKWVILAWVTIYGTLFPYLTMKSLSIWENDVEYCWVVRQHMHLHARDQVATTGELTTEKMRSWIVYCWVGNHFAHFIWACYEYSASRDQGEECGILCRLRGHTEQRIVHLRPFGDIINCSYSIWTELRNRILGWQY